jgi:hypothetical protein
VAIFTTAGFTSLSIEDRDGSLLPEPSDKGSAPYASIEKPKIHSKKTKFLSGDINCSQSFIKKIYLHYIINHSIKILKTKLNFY